MKEEKIKELAREYIDSCTERAGFVILTENIKNDFIDLFVAGFMKCMELNKGINETHNPYTEPCRNCKFLKQEPAESWLDNSYWYCTKNCNHLHPCPVLIEKEEK